MLNKTIVTLAAINIGILLAPVGPPVPVDAQSPPEKYDCCATGQNPEEDFCCDQCCTGENCDNKKDCMVQQT